MLKAMLRRLHAALAETRHGRDRFYPGLNRVTIGQAARTELLLSQVQNAMGHQASPLRPWQRYEPLSTFLDEEIWPTDETVQRDLSFAKLAVQILTEDQKHELEVALAE